MLERRNKSETRNYLEVSIYPKNRVVEPKIGKTIDEHFQTLVDMGKHV